MPYVAVIHGATLLFTGAASLVCGSGVVLVPEVLNNIWLASDMFKLCGTTKQWCCYMAAPTYTVLKTNIINKLKLYGVQFVWQGRCIRHTAWPRRRVTASNQCSEANQEVTYGSSWFDCRDLTDCRGENSPFYREFRPYYTCTWPQRCDHLAGIVPRIATMDGRCPRHWPWILGWWACRIGLLDRYGSPAKCKKVGSCDTLP